MTESLNEGQSNSSGVREGTWTRIAVWALVVLLCTVVFLCILEEALAHDVAPGAKSHDPAPPAVPKTTRNRWGADYFPNVTLVTQHGKNVRLYDDLLKGKSVMVNVMYTECRDACPLETANLVQLQRILGDRVGRDIFFYSISIDPKRDTPELLKNYAEKFDVGPGWLFLTGDEAEIKLVTRKLGLSSSGDAESRDGHAPWLMVGKEPTGQWTKNSAVDNPRFLAARIGTFFGWSDLHPRASYAEAQPVVLEKGQYLFQRQCGLCHTLGRGDNAKGPDLLGVTDRRDRAWLTRYILAPDKMLADGDPIAAALSNKYTTVRMPNLSLASGDVADVIAYLEAHGGSAPREKAQNKGSVTAR